MNHLSDEALLDLYEESQREPGAALLAGCLGLAGGWAGLIVFLGLKGFVLAIAGTMLWAKIVQNAEASRQRQLLASPLPKLLCERGLSTACTFDYLVERARRGEDGATADRPVVVLKGAVSLRAQVDRTARTARIEQGRTTRDLAPADVERLIFAIDDFQKDPRPAARWPAKDSYPSDLLVAGDAVHVAQCSLSDPSPVQPVHRLARLLVELAPPKS